MVLELVKSSEDLLVEILGQGIYGLEIYLGFNFVQEVRGLDSALLLDFGLEL